MSDCRASIIGYFGRILTNSWTDFGENIEFNNTPHHRCDTLKIRLGKMDIINKNHPVTVIYRNSGWSGNVACI